jgi:prophage maintenance system killer protein
MKRKTTKPIIVREPQAGYGEAAIVIYQSPEGVRVDVKLERETVWLNLNQIAGLFDRDKSVISRHLSNIFKEQELRKDSTVAFFATVQDEGGRTIERQIEYYNLDAVISVGYRVNSKRGTQFRIWATGILRDHILKGYTINERRLKELNQAIRLIADVANRRELTGDEAKALLQVVADYSFALDLLDDYDHQRVTVPGKTPGIVTPLAYEEARRIVDHLRGKFGTSNIFGLEKDDSLKGALGAIMQTFDGKDVYLGIEEKAASLLYFLIKDHPFVDGNKRIGVALFIWFMEKNDALYRSDGTKRIADNALVAMTLLIAESQPREKDILTRVLINLISRMAP